MRTGRSEQLGKAACLQHPEAVREYRIEESARYLERIHAMSVRLKGLNSTIEDLRHLVEGLRGQDYSKDRVRGSSDEDRLPSTIASIDELIAEREAVAHQFDAEIARALYAIDKLESPECASALEMHYIADLPWSFIGEQLSYSKPGMMDLRRRALCDFFDVMPKRP